MTPWPLDHMSDCWPADGCHVLWLSCAPVGPSPAPRQAMVLEPMALPQIARPVATPVLRWLSVRRTVPARSSQIVTAAGLTHRCLSRGGSLLRRAPAATDCITEPMLPLKRWTTAPPCLDSTLTHAVCRCVELPCATVGSGPRHVSSMPTALREWDACQVMSCIPWTRWSATATANNCAQVGVPPASVATMPVARLVTASRLGLRQSGGRVRLTVSATGDSAASTATAKTAAVCRSASADRRPMRRRETASVVAVCACRTWTADVAAALGQTAIPRKLPETPFAHRSNSTWGGLDRCVVLDPSAWANV